MMSRREGWTFIAKYARGLIAVWKAREVADALGVQFDMLLFIAPNLVRRNFDGGYAVGVHVGDDMVQVSDLGATICRYMSLYADGDHAMQSPHASPGKQADYIGQRAAIRLARNLGGEGAVRELQQDIPWLKPVLLAERPYLPS